MNDKKNYEMIKKIVFSAQDKEFFASTRASDPAVEQLFKDVRSLMEQFSGSYITYLQIGSREWGVKFEQGVPHIPMSIFGSTKTTPKPTTQNAKRRALTKYKE